MRGRYFSVMLTGFTLVAAGFFMMIGCGTSSIPMGGGITQGKLSATVMGGRKPISGSAITLVEAGNAGRSGQSHVLANSTSDSKGNFSISAFTCLHTDSQLFITASGGDAGNGVNSNILLLAMLGPCSSLPNFVVVNELSTVAAAYTFAQFMNPTDPSQINANGLPDTDAYLGMTNAGLALAKNVINISSGTPAAFLRINGNSPATLNTLADILVSCVNSPPPYTICANLFTAAKPSGGTAPTNTLQAIFAIATHPGQNIANIYGFLAQVPVTLPYTPTFTTAPNDWLLTLRHRPGDLNITRGLKIDKVGNVWIANNTNSSITELSPLGVELSPLGGYTAGGLINHPEEIFIDSGGTAWITNFGNNTIIGLNSSGGVAVAPFGSTTLFNPAGIVIDSFSQIWSTDTGTSSSAEELTVSTTGGVFTRFVGGFGLGTATRIIADTTVSPNIMWVSNSGTGGVSRIVNNGTSALTGGAVAGGGQQGQQGITLDNNGDVWVANTSGGSVTKINGSTGTVALGPISVGGITASSSPWGIAADSANNVWVNNFGSNSVTELDSNGNALSPPTGFATGLVQFPKNDIGIDRSGNVWIANDNDAADGAVIEFLGAAAPVATPRTSGRPIAP